MKAQSKSARLQAASRAEVSPHIRRATSFYQRSVRERPAVQPPTGELSGRRNPTVRAARFEPYDGRKRGGARYGPPPLNPPHRRMQSPTPMSDDRRDEIYARGCWTDRQWRQFNRMQWRSTIRYDREEARRAYA